MPKTTKSLIERLDEKIDKSGDCWIWTGWKNDKGYGNIVIDGRRRRTHIVSYELHVGDVPTGLELDHLCRNRACVKPEHLEAVTHQVNIARGMILKRLDYCQRGHKLDDANSYYWVNKNTGNHERQCRICKSVANRAHYERSKLKPQSGSKGNKL